jgi:hypothetical protein
VFDVSTYLNIPIAVKWKKQKGEFLLTLLTTFKADISGKKTDAHGHSIIAV